MDNTTHEIVKPEQNMDIVIHLLSEETLKNAPTSLYINGIPDHWHRSIEFSYIRKGRVNLWINNTHQELSAGDFIFVNSAQVHRLNSLAINDVEIVLTILPYTTLKHFIPDIDMLQFDIYQNKSYHPRFYEIFEVFYEYTIHPKPYDRLSINSCMFELLQILLTQYQSNNLSLLSNQRIQHQILDYIEVNYQSNITLQQLAREFHFNPEYLSRKFKEIFGTNFKTYLTEYRLSSCLNDLVNSNSSMEDIALQYGFSSIKTFIRSFKQYYPETPYQYRLRMQNKQ